MTDACYIFNCHGGAQHGQVCIGNRLHRAATTVTFQERTEIEFIKPCVASLAQFIWTSKQVLLPRLWRHRRQPC